MFQGLSLDQAPPYKIPLQFYITATLYLIAFGIVFALYSTSIVNRFDYNAIALTHFLTLGFFTHIMFGSMFQMIPVMLGLAYNNVVRNANIIYYTLNLGTLLFVSGFLTAKTALLYAGGTLLLVSFLYFSLLSLKTVLESENKDFMVKTFATSFSLLALGSIFGFLALLVHAGVLLYPYFGDIHMALMLFGWVFLLINAVSYKIIPMFFVAKEFPSWIKNSFYLSVLFLLISFTLLREGELFEVSQAVLLVVAFLAIIFALFSIMILSKRKRKRKDLSITLWYFAMTNLTLAALLFIYRSFFEYEYLDLVIGFFVLFGGIYALINAMLYKIVPFLTWFHLSSNMVFEA
ncbi:MAG: hypothetical protein ABGW85_00925, partial [Sulfurimonas sp.]